MVKLAGDKIFSENTKKKPKVRNWLTRESKTLEIVNDDRKK